MPTDLTFEGVTLSDVNVVADFLAGLARELAPSINVAPGTVNYNTTLYVAAALHMWESGNWGKLANYWNWSAIIADPVGAPDSIVDLLLSNYNAERTMGGQATGSVAIILSSQSPCAVASGTTLTYGGLVFRTAMAFTAVANESDIIDSTDRLLNHRADGNWQLLVDVVADTAGSDGNLPIGTPLVMSPVPAYLAATFAASDFVGGSATQTNADLAVNALDGMAAKILSNRVTTEAAIRTALPSAVVSVIGMSDPEMVRDQRGLLGNSIGSRADVYVRSQASLQTVIKTVAGTSIDSPHGYRIQFGRTDLYGAITVWKVTPAGSSIACPDLNVSWGVDVTDISAPVPDLETAVEAAFSCYQSLSVTFTDATDTGTYDIYIVTMPGVDVAQDLIRTQVMSEPMADWLVKAAIPIVVAVSLTIQAPRSATVDTDAIATAVTEAINGQSFASELNASLIVGAVSALLPARAYVQLPIEMIGRVIAPNRSDTYEVISMAGQTAVVPGSVPNYIRSANSLVSPVDNVLSLSSRTTCFFTDVTKITVNKEAF